MTYTGIREGNVQIVTLPRQLFNTTATFPSRRLKGIALAEAGKVDFHLSGNYCSEPIQSRLERVAVSIIN